MAQLLNCSDIPDNYGSGLGIAVEKYQLLGTSVSALILLFSFMSVLHTENLDASCTSHPIFHSTNPILCCQG